MSTKPMREQLLEQSEEFCRAKGISLARLSTIVVNDGHFFVRLAQGGDCRTATFERFQAYFAAHRSHASDADAA